MHLEDNFPENLIDNQVYIDDHVGEHYERLDESLMRMAKKIFVLDPMWLKDNYLYYYEILEKRYK